MSKTELKRGDKIVKIGIWADPFGTDNIPIGEVGLVSFVYPKTSGQHKWNIGVVWQNEIYPQTIFHWAEFGQVIELCDEVAALTLTELDVPEEDLAELWAEDFVVGD